MPHLALTLGTDASSFSSVSSLLWLNNVPFASRLCIDGPMANAHDVWIWNWPNFLVLIHAYRTSMVQQNIQHGLPKLQVSGSL